MEGTKFLRNFPLWNLLERIIRCDVVAPSCNPSAREPEAGRSGIGGQSELLSKTLFQRKRKNKTKSKSLGVERWSSG